jgi:hypothetical protein
MPDQEMEASAMEIVMDDGSGAGMFDKGEEEEDEGDQNF